MHLYYLRQLAVKSMSKIFAHMGKQSNDLLKIKDIMLLAVIYTLCRPCRYVFQYNEKMSLKSKAIFIFKKQYKILLRRT